MESDDTNNLVTVEQKITHDLVLDIYEQGMHEDDPEKREAIIATAKVLADRIGEYLVTSAESKEK